MYMNPTPMLELAQAKQRDMLVQAQKHRIARQARQGAGITQTRASRRGRRTWKMLRALRAQVQAQW